jgi:hypothetical protein
VLDRDPGLEHAREIKDAEEEQEERGCHERELNENLSPFATGPALSLLASLE